MNTDTPNTADTADRADTADLANFRKLVAGGGRWETCYGPALELDEGGAFRLALTAGWLVGLEASNPTLASHLARSLGDKLRYLGAYGGKTKVTVNADTPWEKVLEAPAYKVLLSDDGTLGGFRVGWYRAITHERYMEAAAELDRDAYAGSEGGGAPMPDDEQRERWDAALASARRNLRIPDLIGKYAQAWASETRSYSPAWAQEIREDGGKVPLYSNQHQTWLYGRAAGGGLLLHGFGEVFSVDLHPQKAGPCWSVHT